MLDDIYFMKQALIEAGKAAERGEVPVGAVVVCTPGWLPPVIWQERCFSA